jgi:hypothetical protein
VTIRVARASSANEVRRPLRFDTPSLERAVETALARESALEEPRSISGPSCRFGLLIRAKPFLEIVVRGSALRLLVHLHAAHRESCSCPTEKS